MQEIDFYVILYDLTRVTQYYIPQRPFLILISNNTTPKLLRFTNNLV